MNKKYEKDLITLGEIFGDSEQHGMSETEALKYFKDDIAEIKKKYTKEECLELLKELAKEDGFKADEIKALGKKIGWPRVNVVRTIIA
jgi:3-methyladenine DNA glycosylase AlkD